MTKNPQPSTQAFLVAMREIANSLGSPDSTALPALMERQLQCFDALRVQADLAGSVDSAELAQTIAATEEILASASRQLILVREELAQVRHARTSAAVLRRNEPTARFISRRA